jgi:hypothetical protein
VEIYVFARVLAAKQVLDRIERLADAPSEAAGG